MNLLDNWLSGEIADFIAPRAAHRVPFRPQSRRRTAKLKFAILITDLLSATLRFKL